MTVQALTKAEIERILATRPILVDSSGEGAASPILGLLVSSDREQLAKLMTEHRFESSFPFGRINTLEYDIFHAKDHTDQRPQQVWCFVIGMIGQPYVCGVPF